MLNVIDKILDRITMYRLMLYYLIALILGAIILGALGILPYTPTALIFSTALLIGASWVTNTIFARLLKIPTNVESVYITALILVLIVSPPQTGEFLATAPVLILTAVVAMASKYLVAIGKKHIFNPVAFAVAVTSLVIGQSASWWVGTAAMLPLVAVGGLLMIRKLRRFDLVIAFVTAALVAMVVLAPGNISSTLTRALLSSPLIFFASVMLTEPLTLPPTRDGRIAYAVLVGWLFAPQTHFGSLTLTPELALLAGNIFSYVISPKGRHVFTLKEIKEVGRDVYDFIFQSDRPFAFEPGQYMEWTLGHPHPDSRGNRRYFTLASSPTEKETVLGVKFYDNPSSFKKNMLSMNSGTSIIGSQLAGDFTLPKDTEQKLVFLAGGIGITPFRSMLKYLLDHNQHRSIIVLYANRTADEIAYRDVLDQAQHQLNIPTVYTLSDASHIPADWNGYRGYISEQMITKEIPDYTERTFYISGSQSMVSGSKNLLLHMGIARTHIKTDFFPGLV